MNLVGKDPYVPAKHRTQALLSRMADTIDQPCPIDLDQPMTPPGEIEAAIQQLAQSTPTTRIARLLLALTYGEMTELAAGVKAAGNMEVDMAPILYAWAHKQVQAD